MKIYLILLCCVATNAAVSSNNYCAKSCKDYARNKSITNIGCYHNQKFAATCPSDAKMVIINNSLKKILVDAHNVKRNFIAGGGDAKHSPACRMAFMQWDNELAYLAALNVKQCQRVHDRCHKTYNFEYAGQNLFEAWQSPPRDFNDTEKIIQAVNEWYKEVKNSKQSYIDSYPKNYNSTLPVIGHFTVMVADRNTHFGCAIVIFTRSVRRHYLMACNYATTNMMGFPIYAKCKNPATSCKTGKHPQYTNLCSAFEQYAVNKWF